MARFKLIDPDYYLKKRQEFNKQMEEAKKHPSPKMEDYEPIIFPEGTTREDVYPSNRKYHGD